MPPPRAADTIRILIATDSHVGYAERDPVRKDDSWASFDEVMQLAKTEDVDMVLLAGDLFHDNAPSRKAMYQVMRSLRQNCLGDKPCELEFLSDATDVLGTHHVNYEDPDINISIPVFSIHGNHDDPSGDGHFCSLDLLQVSGLLNYFGKVPETDKIEIKPVLLQKGQTKLALYGMSNVRDERLFRTFRDKNVKLYTPGTQKKDWFNLMAVHQNHHAHTETSYLPENFLPDFMDLVVWGHEHECLIDPRLNPEMMFQVMQPGSSIATSLVPGEAVAKHVAIISVTGKQFTTKKIRLKTVRPFITRDLVLATDPRFKNLARVKDNRIKLVDKLSDVVKELIEEAKSDWLAAQDPDDAPDEVPLPLVRIKVEHTAPDGGKFDLENPQRFSNRFQGHVANVTDVVQFYKKKVATRGTKAESHMPDEAVLAALDSDNVKVGKLVHEYLSAQSLKIIPQAPFGDAITQYVEKDDKNIMDTFVEEELANQVKEMMVVQMDEDEEDLEPFMEEIRAKQEATFAAGLRKKSKKKGKLRPKPDDWNDALGAWEDQPGAFEENNTVRQEDDDEDDGASLLSATAKKPAGKKAPVKKAPAKPKAPPKTKPPAKTKAPAKGRKKIAEPSDDEDDDVVMLGEAPTPKAQPKRAAATKGRQTQLTFTQSQAKSRASRELSDDEISDDDDAFEAMSSKKRR